MSSPPSTTALPSSSNVKQSKLTVLLALLCAFSVGVMVYALRVKPAFTPPPFDASAQAGLPEDIPGFEMLDAQSFQAGLLVMPNLEGNQLHVYFANPAENSCNLRLRVMDEGGRILGQSGLIRPGEFIQAVTLEQTVENGATVIFKLMAYEPETYYSAGAVTVTTRLQIS